MGALGLARRAGALAIGFDAVAQAVKAGRAQLVLVASDTSPKTLKRLAACCTKDMPPTELGLTKDELARITVKPAGVLAITNKDLAALCHKALAGKEETV